MGFTGRLHNPCMGITNGTLLKQGKYWHWKYRLDGEGRWESLKTESKREAQLIRQRRIADYHQDAAKYKQRDLNPRLETFEADYFQWAVDHKRRNTIEMERRFWKQMADFTGAKRLYPLK